jgi:hypothetical protein
MLLFLLYFLITPALGSIKNIIKYKQFDFKLFIRTPIITFVIYNLLNLFQIENIILLSIIFERWIMFVYKIIMAYVNDDYNKKKEKYKIKYNLEYKD